MNTNSIKISSAENNLKLIEASDVNNLPDDIKRNFNIKNNEDKQAVIKRLKDDIINDKNTQESLANKRHVNDYEIQRIFNKAADNNIKSYKFISRNVVPLNDNYFMSNDQVPFIEAGIPFDEYVKRQNIEVDPKYYKAAKNEYDNQLGQLSENLNSKLIEKGIELQDVSNLTVIDGRNNPAYQATMTQLKRQLVENSVVFKVRDTRHSTNSDLQSSDKDWRDKANLNMEDTQITRITAEEGALGTELGDAIFQVTSFYPKDFKEGSIQSPKAGTIRDKHIITVPAIELNQDLNVQMIRDNTIARMDPNYRAASDLAIEVAYKDLAASLPFSNNGTDYSKSLAIDTKRGLGYNMNVLIKDLTPGEPFKALINNTPVTILKNRDGNMSFTVMKENGITPLYQEEYTERTKRKLPTDFIEPFLGRPTTTSKFMAGFAAQTFQIK